MPFEIVRNDITNMQADAIVNTANPRPVAGAGSDGRIHAKAGPELLEARKKIGDIPVGGAAVTPGFDLNARYVIHTVGPYWRGGLFGEKKLLRKCYDSALTLAADLGCQSVAFPLISAGSYRFPADQALSIALQAISEFLLDHEMKIFLVVFSRDAFQLSEKLFREVASYVDEHYVEKTCREEYGRVFRNPPREPELRELAAEWDCRSVSASEALPSRPYGAMAAEALSEMPAGDTLTEMLENTDVGFSETLLMLIDRTGKKDSEIYTRANISRQHFSKIRNNPHYKPTKATAVAFAIALELDLEQTRDLIGRAGYALTKSSKFDVIVMYFIREGNYNLFDINAALFKFDQSLLGA